MNTTIDEPQEIIIGSTEFNHANFKNNYIRTTKYTSITFLPMCLFNQLNRYANLYFLIVAILYSIPQFTPLSPISAWASLIFVLGVAIMRESFEDLARYKSDLETNSVKTQIQVEGDWRSIESKDLYAGDIIKVSNLEHFPADIVALASSNLDGKIYTMTTCINGDKNLQEKFALKETQDLIGDSDQFVLMGTLKYELPNENYNSFRGTLAIGESPVKIISNNFLLSGTMLKNTNWIIGIVIYTGKNTKIMQNSTKRIFKQTKLERTVNWIIIILIVLILFLSAIIFVGSAIWNSSFSLMYAEFIPIRYNSATEGFLSGLSSFVLFSSILPVTLILTLEIVRVLQSFFINKDQDMLDRTCGRYSRVLNSSLHENLGQIKYVFADKTGTLTSNMLEFRYAFIGDTFFGDQNFLEGKKEAKKKITYVNKTEGIFYSFNDRRMSTTLTPEAKLKTENFTFIDSRHNEIFWIRNQFELIEHILLAISICHSCVSQSDGENHGKIKYSGIFQDEVVLVDAARHLGVVFKEETNNGKIVEIHGETQEIEVLHYFPFDSTRKRSSIIIKHDGYIKHFIKGAGEAIGERLNTKIEQPYLEKTEIMIEKFSLAGLRTLCFGMRVISLEDYKEIDSKIKSFTNTLNEFELIKEVADKIEVDFWLLGCTAIEDKLQPRVAETINDFQSAKIKVWMLTGDKREIAESVGYNCKLMDQMTKKLYLEKGDNIDSKFTEFRQELDHKEENQKFTLIINDYPISELEGKADLAKAYAKQIFARCDSVIGARMNPYEKGKLTKLMKKYTGKVVLAIGDGANDVDMIQNADIGIGIYGKEGTRAIQAADYGLVDFQSLWKLVFVHGHWSYIRTSELVQMFCHKNLLLVIPQFLYCFFNCYSAQTLFDDYYITFYNLIFTLIPLLARGCLDQDMYYRKWTSRIKNKILEKKVLYERKTLKQYFPQLYYVGRKNELFRFPNKMEIFLCMGGQRSGYGNHRFFFRLCKHRDSGGRWKRT